MKYKVGDCILANSKINDITRLKSGIIVKAIERTTVSAYRISWINTNFESWNSVTFIDRNYLKVSKEVASEHAN